MYKAYGNKNLPIFSMKRNLKHLKVFIAPQFREHFNRKHHEISLKSFILIYARTFNKKWFFMQDLAKFYEFPFPE